MIGTGAKTRAAAASQRCQDWVERQGPDSAAGVAISAWRHYRAVDGPLQSALLSLYILVAVLPALLVMEDYLDPRRNALASWVVDHYELNAATGALIHSVLGEGHSHALGAALIAIASALFFGLGFGRVLQLVHARSWQLTLPNRPLDQALYAGVLLGIYGLIVLMLVQLTKLQGAPIWIVLALGLGWIALLVLFFVWAPWLLTHKRIDRRDLLPAAVLTALGLVVLMLASDYVMQSWLG